jgi:hypothetical protein
MAILAGMAAFLSLLNFLSYFDQLGEKSMKHHAEMKPAGVRRRQPENLMA